MMMMMKTMISGMLAVIPVAVAACGTNPVSGDSRGDVTSENANGEAIRWHEPIEVASGGGHRGPWRMNRSEWDFVDDATVAVNEQGFIGVAWAYHPSQDVMFQLYAPDGTPRFEEPVNVSRSSDIFSWLPRVILTDADDPEAMTVYLLWQEIVFSGGSHGGEIFFSRSTDGGTTFSDPINLSNTVAGAGKGRQTSQRWHNGSYDIVRAPNGDLYVTWTEYEGNLWFSRSTDDGRSFSDPKHIAGGDENRELPVRGPSLAVDGDGRIYLAWAVGERDDANIELATSNDGGRSFTTPRPIQKRDGHADAPRLAVDKSGTVHLAYMESEDGPFRQYRIFYATADREDLDFAEPRDVSAAQRGRFASAGFPALELDGNGRVHLMWELFQHARGRPIAMGLTRSSDGGKQFSEPILVPGAFGTDDRASGGWFSGSQQGLLMRKLAVNEHGTLAIVNSTFRSNSGSHIWLVRGEVARESEDE